VKEKRVSNLLAICGCFRFLLSLHLKFKSSLEVSTRVRIASVSKPQFYGAPRRSLKIAFSVI
jgi:hypothetical protein